MNFPADMLPMYTASMSSERSLASWIAFSPASIPRSRKERSHNSPNSVSPTPMTATSRIDLGLPHEDLAAVLRVGRVVDEDLVRDHVFDRRRRIASDLRDLVRNGEVGAVGTGAAAVADGEDPVSRLGLVEDRAEAYHDCAAVCVPDVPHAEARVHLRFLEAELLRHPDGELAVRLMEDRVVVVLRGRAGPLEEELGAVDDVLEVRGLAGEATAVARIPLAFAPPEVWGVGRERDGVADVRDRAVRPDQERGPARRRTVLERIARRTLARVGADRESVLHHLREGQAHCRLNRSGSGFARELEVRRRHDRTGSDRCRHDRRGRLDRVRMGLRSGVARADLGGGDVELRHARPRRLDGDRDDVLVGTRDALRADVQPATHRLAVGAPDHPDVLRSILRRRSPARTPTAQSRIEGMTSEYS